MKHGKKKPKESILRKKLWKVLSLYVRKRDKFTCITCSRVGEGSAIHAGHFVPASVGGLALRYNDRNIFAQCYSCNINKGGWGERYAEVLESRYGRKYIDDLRQLKGTIVKDFPWEEKIKEYEQKLAELNKK